MVEIPALLDATLVVVAVVVLLASTAHFTYHPRTRAYPGPVLIFILFSSGMGILLRSAMHLAAINIAFPTDREPSDGASPPVPLTLVDVAHAALMQASVLPIRVSIPFWAMLYFTSAATFWYLMLAMDLISSLSNPFLPFQANNILHHVVTWPAASAWVAAFYLFFRTDAESATPTTSLRMWMILPMYVVMAYITIALFVTWRKSRTLETQAHTTTRRMAKQIMPYLFVFGLGGLVDICLYAAEVHIETVTGYRSWPVNIMHQITQVVQVVAVLMLFQRKAGWVLCWRRRTTVASLQAVAQLSPCASPMDDTQRATEDDDRLSGEDLSVSNVMRQCIMKYTSMGIIESAQSAVAKAPADITLEDYTVVENKIVIVHGEMDSAILTFRDCAPAVFQHIRSMCGISQADYVNSFALDRNMNEHGSEGKSGNLFYFTANKRFMVKSVPEDEFEALRSILPSYHTYLQTHPKSFLCRYFGCHSISLPVGTRRMYFVVMHNLFDEGPVDHRFDLKGNTDRRQAIQSHHVEQYIARSQNREYIAKLMMDIDFLKLRQAVHVDESDEAEMQSQLIQDITFLATQSIMDYSVLLGVKFVRDEHTTTNATVSKTRDRVYYVGIIDMLQRYTWRWTLQRWFLGLVCCKDMGNVSAVPPNEYGKRLTHFIRSRFFHTPGKTRYSGWTNLESPAPPDVPRPSGPSAWTTEDDFMSPSAAAMWRNAQSPFHMQMVPPHRKSGGFFVASSF